MRAHFCHKVANCGIFTWSIMEFVRQIYCWGYFSPFSIQVGKPVAYVSVSSRRRFISYHAMWEEILYAIPNLKFPIRDGMNRLLMYHTFKYPGSYGLYGNRILYWMKSLSFYTCRENCEDTFIFFGIRTWLTDSITGIYPFGNVFAWPVWAELTCYHIFFINSKAFKNRIIVWPKLEILEKEATQCWEE